MAKTAAQPKTMASNHKVASVLSTGLFAILCVLIAFPLLAGLSLPSRKAVKWL